MPFPTVQQFLNSIDEFSDTDPDRVASAMEQAGLFVDVDIWNETDYPWGVIYLAAHLLATRPGTRGSISIGGQIINLDEVYVASASFGERRLSFGRRSGGGSATPGGGSTSVFGDLGTTAYGIQFNALLRRNVPAIAIV